MKYSLFFLVVFLFCCEGRLSDEQRRKMKEQMELHKIKRVTEAEITESAYRKGREVMNVVMNINDSSTLRNTLAQYDGKVRFIVPGKGNALDLEQQLVDAYLADETGAMQDNVQKHRRGNTETDSLLYTKPVITKLPDGSERLEGVWNVWLSKKELILAMGKK